MTVKCSECGYNRVSSDVHIAPEYECPKCGIVYAKAKEAMIAKKGGYSAASRLKPNTTNENIEIGGSKGTDIKNQLDAKVFGALASILIFIGAFTPIFAVSIAGNLSYYGKDEGVIIFLLSIVGMYLSLTNRTKFLWQTALITMATMVMTATHFWVLMLNQKHELSEALSNNPFKGLANIALNSIHPEWGWLLLISGVVLFFLSAYKARKSELSDKLINKSLVIMALTIVLGATIGLTIAKLNIKLLSERSSLNSPYKTQSGTSNSLINKFQPRKKVVSTAEKRIGALVNAGHAYAMTCKANLVVYKKDKTGDCAKLSSVLDDIHTAGSIKNYSSSLSDFERVGFQNKLKRMLNVSNLQEEIFKR